MSGAGRTEPPGSEGGGFAGGGAETERDVAVVLSGGSINGALMELGFLRRLRATPLWPRIRRICGTSAGALSGTMAALDRLDDLETFLYALQPQDTFRPHRLWQLPIAGFHSYELPRTIEARLGGIDDIARDLARAEPELLVCVTDVSAEPVAGPHPGEMVYSSHESPPDEMAQAILASAAISALVLPLRVGDRVGTDGAWVRNFPLGHAYRSGIGLIVGFVYMPKYNEIRIDLATLRRRLARFRRIAPMRALLEELEAAQERQRRGEPGHHVELIIRLLRLAVARNTIMEHTTALEKDMSIRELEALRASIADLVAENVRGSRRRRLQAAIDQRFASARFPFGRDSATPRITIVARPGEVSLEPGLRTQAPWTDEAKRALIDLGYELADRELRDAGVAEDAA
jgi:predicted acylesterase/phospholipase RssA